MGAGLLVGAWCLVAIFFGGAAVQAQCIPDGEPAAQSCCATFDIAGGLGACAGEFQGASVCDGETAFPDVAENGFLVENDDDVDCVALDRDESEFTIYVLPDTQRYVQKTSITGNPDCATRVKCQMDGIVANQPVDKDNIQFVVHVGDIIHSQQNADNDETWALDGHQWYLASAGLQALQLNAGQPQGLVPFAFSPGNHDYDDWEDEDGVGDDKGVNFQADCFGSTEFGGISCYEKFNEHLFNGFGPDWQRGRSPSGESSIQLFEPVDGLEMLHIVLAYRAPDEELEWVRDRLDEFPDVPAVLTTHSYLVPARQERGDPGDLRPPHLAFRDCEHATPQGDGFNSGASIGEKLVDLYPQIFLVLSGHKNGASLRTTQNFLGWDVYERVVDFQSMINGAFEQCGGDGWLDIIHFFMDAADPPSILFETASFSYDAAVSGPGTDISGCRSCGNGFDLDALRQNLEDWEIHRLAPTQDTSLDEDTLNVPYGDAPDVLVRSSGPGVGRRHGLIQFPDPPPPGSGQELDRAVLTLTLEGSGSGTPCPVQILPMLQAWAEDDVWSVGYDGDGVTPGDEALDACSGGGSNCVVGQIPSCFDLYEVDAPGCLDPDGESPTLITQSFDVTAHVAEWLGGETNNGWAVVPGPTQFCDPSGVLQFRSSEWKSETEPVEVERPMLTIAYKPLGS